MIKVAIVGASGLVGLKILEILREENLLKRMDITLYASNRSSGKILMFDGRGYRILLLDDAALKKKFDIVFFSAGDEVSKIWAKNFASLRAYVIDNSNAFRAEKDVPLVVPEINISSLKKETHLISNPNCSTIQLAVVLDRFKNLPKMKEVIVSTYQSASGGGNELLNSLKNSQKYEKNSELFNNILAKIGEIDKNGFSKEENKIMFELSKILGKRIKTCATAVRVPIPYCHGESVFVEFEEPVSVSEIEQCLDCDYIKIDDDISLPTVVANTNLTHVCRIRNFSENEICLFVVADNLRRGAAYNAVEIAKHVIENFL